MPCPNRRLKWREWRDCCDRPLCWTRSIPPLFYPFYEHDPSSLHFSFALPLPTDNVGPVSTYELILQVVSCFSFFVWLIRPVYGLDEDPALVLETILEKLIVLTFDDSAKSLFESVRPILLKYRFGATFFITEGFDFATNKTDYMTWEQVATLNREVFEIGKHTRDHLGIGRANVDLLDEQLSAIRDRCRQHSIPDPVSFAWPGNSFTPEAFGIFKQNGIRFARRGGVPEYSDDRGQGFAYEPAFDHPLLIPSAGDVRPNWEFDYFFTPLNKPSTIRSPCCSFTVFRTRHMIGSVYRRISSISI